MPRRTVAPCGVVLALAPASCTPSHVDAVWPEPRPLGKNVPTYGSPVDPPVPLTAVEEPVGVVSLREVLKLALLRNPDLAAFALGARAAEARTLQAGAFPNPGIGLTVEDFGGTGAGRGVRAAETTVQLSQLLELGGKRVKRVRLAGLEHDLAGWDYETKRLAVLTEATKAFIDVLVAQERLALATDVVRLAEQVLTTVTERAKAGKVSPVEATRASVPVATARLQAARAQSASEAARTHLAASWGSRSPTFAGVSGTLDTLAPMPPAATLATLIAQNPDVARWATEVTARQVTVAVEYSKRVPDLTVSGGVRYVSETEHTAFVAGIALPLPLFNRNQGGIQEAHVRVMQAEQQRRAAEVRVSTAFADAYQTLATTYNESTVLQTTVLPAAQRAFEAATEGYRQGKFGFLDVLDAQRTLFETRGQYLDALATYHKAVADVEQLIGQELAPAAQAGARSTGDQPTSRVKHNEHGHADEKHVRLNAEKSKQLGIEVVVAQAGRLQERLTVPGTAGARLPEATGTVSYIGPLVSEETRTVLMRIMLPNPDGRWRPGLFVTASLVVAETPVQVLIPKAALQTLEGQPSVFVQTDEGFEPRPVTLGRADETHVEITAGLTAGERYAATETFILKADLGKGTASHQD